MRVFVVMVATKIEESKYEQCLEKLFYCNDRKKLSLNCLLLIGFRPSPLCTVYTTVNSLDALNVKGSTISVYFIKHTFYAT